MTLPETIGVVVGVITILGAVAGLTRYVTHLQYEIRLQRLRTERETAENAQAELRATNDYLKEELAGARRAGAAAAAKKGDVDDALAAVMKRSDASAGSVYVPLPVVSGGSVEGLAFLSIQPITLETLKLRKQTIPMQSLAGRCFSRGEAFVVSNSKTSADHYARADNVTGFRTHDTLNIPLQIGSEVVGVLQLLNRQSGRFEERDISDLGDVATQMAKNVKEFLNTSESFEILGLSPQVDDEAATVMFCDLTASSTLFSELNVSSAVRHLNEYLEAACDIAFRHGATVDKYVGDGVLLRFNVPRPVEDHPFQAVRAAFEINGAFDAIKRDWLTMGEALGALHVRSGIAFGGVRRATVGHPQYQYLTIFGTPVNAAVNLCDIAARDRNVVVIDDRLHEAIKDRIDAVPLSTTPLGKAGKYTASAWEVRAVRP